MAGVGPFAVPLAASGTKSGPKSGNVKQGNKGKKERGGDKNGKEKKSGNQDQNQDQDQDQDQDQTPQPAYHVYANDLNPRSFTSLNENRRLNKLNSSLLRPVSNNSNSSNSNNSNFLETYNMCGQKFIRAQYANPECNSIDHCIMNLPQTAVDLLDAFIGVGNIYDSACENNNNNNNNNNSSNNNKGEEGEKGGMKLPRIHVYGFSTFIEDPVADMARRACISMNCPFEELYPHGAGTYVCV